MIRTSLAQRAFCTVSWILALVHADDKWDVEQAGDKGG
jgi:hypothetical protein